MSKLLAIIDTMPPEWGWIIFALILGGTVAVASWPHVRPNPKDDELLRLIFPLAQEAISLAYEVDSNWRELGTPLTDDQKKATAMWMYENLPPKIGGYDTEILKQSVLTPKAFDHAIEFALRMTKVNATNYMIDGKRND